MPGAIKEAENCLIGFTRLGERCEIALAALLIPCPTCHGTKQDGDLPCLECFGEGVVPEDHNAAVIEHYYSVKNNRALLAGSLSGKSED